MIAPGRRPSFAVAPRGARLNALLGALAVLATGCTDAAAPESVDFGVTVVEAGVHAPLAGVEIAPLDAAGKDLGPLRVTGPDGTAHCDFVLPAGHDHTAVAYEVRKAGYVPQRVGWWRLRSTGAARHGGVEHGPIALERSPAKAPPPR